MGVPQLVKKVRAWVVESACLPGAELIDFGEALNDLRMNKSDFEAEMVRQACLISEKAFDNALGKINPEMTEYELEGVLAAELYRNGGEGPSFPILCYSGYRSRMGIGRSTHNKLGRDNIIAVFVQYVPQWADSLAHRFRPQDSSFPHRCPGSACSASPGR